MSEETKKIVTEDENLNWNEEKTTYTQEEVDAMRKSFFDKDDGVQALLRKNKNTTTAMTEIPKVAENKEYLIELYDSNPEVAKIILDNVYGWKSIDDFKEAIWYQEDLTDPNIIEKKAAELAKKQIEAQKVETAKSEFIEKFKLEWSELKDFEEAFSERMDLKTFSAGNVDKHLEKALLEITDQTLSERLKSQKNIANTMATWEWKSWGTSTKKDSSIQKQSQDFLKKFWVISN